MPLNPVRHLQLHLLYLQDLQLDGVWHVTPSYQG